MDRRESRAGRLKCLRPLKFEAERPRRRSGVHSGTALAFAGAAVQPTISLRGGTTMALFTRFWKNEEGQDLAEYALLIALIALVVIGAVTLLGTRIQTVFNNIANALNP